MAANYNFNMEIGNLFQITYNYTDTDGVPINLENHCIFFRWLTDTGVEYKFSSTENTTDYSLSGNSDGSISLKIPARTNQAYSFATATYDLETVGPSETYTGSGKPVERLVSGSITFIGKSVSVNVDTLVCDPYFNTNNVSSNRIPDINDVEYTGSGFSTADKGSSSDTITITDSYNINYLEVSINNFNYKYPQDLRILLSPPSGNKILLAGHEKIINNVENFNIVFSNTAPADKFLYNVKSNEPARITDKTSIIKYNDETLSADLSVFQNTSTLGDWSLIIVDDDASKVGSIGSWALTFNHT